MNNILEIRIGMGSTEIDINKDLSQDKKDKIFTEITELVDKIQSITGLTLSKNE